MQASASASSGATSCLDPGLHAKHDVMSIMELEIGTAFPHLVQSTEGPRCAYLVAKRRLPGKASDKHSCPVIQGEHTLPAWSRSDDLRMVICSAPLTACPKQEMGWWDRAERLSRSTQAYFAADFGAPGGPRHLDTQASLSFGDPQA